MFYSLPVEYNTSHTVSAVPQQLMATIPHTETSAGSDRKYAISFLDNQEVRLSDSLKAWPPMEENPVYHCQDEFGKLIYQFHIVAK